MSMNEKPDSIFPYIEKTPFKLKSYQYKLEESSEKLSLAITNKYILAHSLPGIMIWVFLGSWFLSVTLIVPTILLKILYVALVFLVISFFIKLTMIASKNNHYHTIYFDKRFKNFIQKDNTKPHTHDKVKLSWSELHALQIVKLEIKRFQMNLITKEAKRLHISTYHNVDQLFKDAEIISQLLNIPIWMEGMEGLEMLKTK